jgi:hypothetical protein
VGRVEAAAGPAGARLVRARGAAGEAAGRAVLGVEREIPAPGPGGVGAVRPGAARLAGPRRARPDAAVLPARAAVRRVPEEVHAIAATARLAAGARVAADPAVREARRGVHAGSAAVHGRQPALVRLVVAAGGGEGEEDDGERGEVRSRAHAAHHRAAAPARPRGVAPGSRRAGAPAAERRPAAC